MNFRTVVSDGLKEATTTKSHSPPVYLMTSESEGWRERLSTDVEAADDEEEGMGWCRRDGGGSG